MSESRWCWLKGVFSMCANSVTQLCLTLCSPPGFSVHGIFQARTLEQLAISFSRGSSRPRDQTCVSWVCCIGQVDSLLLGGSVVRICLPSWRRRFDPRVRKIPWRWKWQPSPVFLPGESHGQRNLEATVHGVVESDTTDWAWTTWEAWSKGTNFQLLRWVSAGGLTHGRVTAVRNTVLCTWNLPRELSEMFSPQISKY